MLTQVSPPFSKETEMGVGMCHTCLPFYTASRNCIRILCMYVTVDYAFLLFREEVLVHRLVKSCLIKEGQLYMSVCSSSTPTNKKVSHSCIHQHLLHNLTNFWIACVSVCIQSEMRIPRWRLCMILQILACYMASQTHWLYFWCQDTVSPSKPTCIFCTLLQAKCVQSYVPVLRYIRTSVSVLSTYC